MNENINCPLCNNKAAKYPRVRDGETFDCENCGKYFLSGTSITILKFEEVRHIIPKVSSWIKKKHQNKDLDCVDITSMILYEIEEKSIIQDVFDKTDFENNTMFDDEYNIDYLFDLQTILDNYNDYKYDIFNESKKFIDLCCLQEIYQIALRLSLDEDGDVDMRIRSYICMLKEYEIDFKLIEKLAWADSFIDDFSNEEDKDSDINILKFLINNNYDKVIRFLKRGFKTNQELLEFIIKGFNIYSTYNELKYENISIDELIDYPEIMRLYTWADGGFDISGES